MLERASSCLESGGRKLLRGPKQCPRTRRMLHSAFWHHGAGDLSLPIWWASVIPSSDKGIREQEGVKYRVKKGQREEMRNGQNGILLDFLYPAKTMALIKTISSYGWDTWDSRRKHQYARNSARQFSSRTGNIQEYISTETDWETEAHDLQELEEELQHSNAIDALRERLRSNDPHKHGLVWRLYQAVEDSDRSQDLRADLVDYLASSEKSVDASRLAQVFDCLSTEHRRASSYRAAISSHLRFNMVGQAVKLHDEAAQRAIGFRFGSDILLARTVQDNQWDLAIRIYQVFIGFWRRQGLDRDYRELWAIVSKLPGLSSNAISFLHYLQQFSHQFQATTGKRYFVAMFVHDFAESLVENILRAETPDEKFIYDFFRALRTMEMSTPRLYEKTITRLLSLPRYHNYKNGRKLHLNLYRMYLDEAKERSYRDDFLPSKGLISRLISQMRRYDSIEDRAGWMTTVDTLIDDWRNLYGALQPKMLLLAMNSYSRVGFADKVHQYFNEYRSQKLDPVITQNFVYPLLYVHARRVEVPAVIKQFKRISEEFGMDPDITSWNILLYAYVRADDLDGTLKCFDDLLKSGCKPDKYSFGPVLDLCAKRGDVEAVQKLFSDAELRGVPDIRDNVMARNALVLAHANSGDLDEAEAAAESMLRDYLVGNLQGSLTHTWNILITKYALQGDMISTMRAYKRMQDSGIPIDTWTYGALMQVLISRRQTNAAYKILRVTMPNNNVQAHGFHYALVMAGFVNEGQFHRALHANKRMAERKVRPTVSSRIASLKALALAEMQELKRKRVESPMERLVELEEALREILAASDPSDLAPKQPRHGLRQTPLNQVSPDGYFEFIVFLYGARGAFHVCQEMFEAARAAREDEEGRFEAPLQLLAAIMDAHSRAKEHDEVDKCWELALEQAAKLVKLMESPAPHVAAAYAVSPTDPSTENLFAMPTPQKLNAARISRNRRHLLTVAIRVYLRDLLKRKDPYRVNTIRNTVSALLHDGYVMDSITWNEFIQVLARSGRMLDAFTACEAYLMPNFLGWRFNSPLYKRRDPSGYDMMDVRPANTRDVNNPMPRYKTMVFLAAAFAIVKRADATEQAHEHAGMGWELHKIQQLAPRTIHAIETMPIILDDKLQRKYLLGL
ncbi:hypothetical protein K432DRAFT_349174 [Lepidopterella palustris CBS 459.81]|uniref:Pentacotripeptide-repeat region of PRORP domain-containing protein n=1 Tax=Lepidopterella palustris CBS 459.81 TaxID=1314670 RepID=A0A8E2EE58_9PEZI|nr:hypothetical protein K432DRAFT_349174 [Lepidopterella palustris CBS 459.81]